MKKQLVDIFKKDDCPIFFPADNDAEGLAKYIYSNLQSNKIYIVIYHDYDCQYDILGVFTNKTNAEKCQEYHERLTAEKDYGNYIETIAMSYYDDIDYNAEILELEEKERREKQAKEDAIKQADLEEFNRIKEKYGL